MKWTIQKLAFMFLCALALPAPGQTNKDVEIGPIYAEFPLTLTSGYRREALGPLYYRQNTDEQEQWGLPPLFSLTRTRDVNWTEWEILYPIISYRRFGGEYRLSLVEFFSFSGGKSEPETDVRRFTFFPLYFRQRSPDTNLNYTAVAPFYGRLENRLFRDEIKFILFPLYSQTRKRDVVTDNYLYPIFDVRRGDHLTGWQVWPLMGVEHKAPTCQTNNLGQVEVVGGFDKYFALWPFYFQNWTGLGTTNQETNLTVVPFYCRSRSPARDQTSYGWPLGYNIIHDREHKYVEHDFVWPLFVTAHGEKTETRLFPFYSRAHNPDLESDFYLWPVYKFNRLDAKPLERRRTRLFFFLYSDTTETNAETAVWTHRNDFWPFYSYERDLNGNRRWQALALLEPFFPDNRTVPREYSPVWSLWRWEKNPRTGDTSQSLLWNLYRRETAPHSKKFSLLFGLFQYESGAESRRWRICHVTVKKEAVHAAVPQS